MFIKDSIEADIAIRHEIMKTLEALKKITETVMIATHDMQLVCQWAERIIVHCYTIEDIV